MTRTLPDLSAQWRANPDPDEYPTAAERSAKTSALLSAMRAATAPKSAIEWADEHGVGYAWVYIVAKKNRLRSKINGFKPRGDELNNWLVDVRKDGCLDVGKRIRSAAGFPTAKRFRCIVEPGKIVLTSPLASS